MKPVSEFEAKYKPLFEGSRMSTIVKGAQFRVCNEDGYEVGLITQHSSTSYFLDMNDGCRMTFAHPMSVQQTLVRMYPTYTFKDINS